MKRMKLVGPVIASLLGCASGCTGHDDPASAPPAPVQAPAPKPETEPQPEPAAPTPAELIRVSVASVNVQDDCAPQPALDEAMGNVARGDMSADQERSRPSCVQSAVQLAIESEAAVESSFSVRAVRIQRPGDGEALATMTAREPTIWDDAKYAPWNQRIPAGDSMNVSYALGASDWSAVSRASDRGLFVVALDVVVDGEVRTIVSPVVNMEPVETMVT